MPFDPAVLTDDDGRVYLYYGYAPAEEKAQNVPRLTEEEIALLPEEIRDIAVTLMNMPMGENGMVAELEPDMLTLKETPHILVPGGKHTKGTGFESHGFFEASSIRKVGQKYYFVYSSHKSHELCYAISDKPDRDFVYGGTIISNGDIGLNGRENPVYPLGNNHGGMVQVNGEWYIFYHRQTNGTECSRQGCAEKIKISDDGSIQQVEITSCGLNGEPLAGKGSYPASIACHLTDPETLNVIDYENPIMRRQTRITEQQNVSYITAIKNGTVLGYKYFTRSNATAVALELRGNFHGTVKVYTDEKETILLGECTVIMQDEYWNNVSVHIRRPDTDKFALYFVFEGTGELDMKSFSFLAE